MKDLPCVTKPQCSLQYRGSGCKCKCIAHSIFCFHTTQVGRVQWLETILSTTLRKKSAEEKQLISLKLGLPNSQSAVCFALCIGAFSDTALKVYTAANVNEDLEKAKEFLQTNIIAKKSKKVFLPKLFERVAREASIEFIEWFVKTSTKNFSTRSSYVLMVTTDRKRRKSLSGCLAVQNLDMLYDKSFLLSLGGYDYYMRSIFRLVTIWHLIAEIMNSLVLE